MAAAGAGWPHDLNGTHDPAFSLAAGLCVVTTGMCTAVSRRAVPATGA